MNILILTRREALQIWQQDYDATYQKLADAFKRAGYEGLADYVNKTIRTPGIYI